MVLSLAFQLGFCCAALAVLTQPSPPSSLTLPIHPGPTLSTLYTTPIVLHEARVETTIDSYIIGYTSTQGVCKKTGSYLLHSILIDASSLCFQLPQRYIHCGVRLC
jgi:hypothetical protein